MARITLNEELARTKLLEESGHIDKALEVTKKIYLKHKVRPVLRRLTELSIKAGDARNAEIYLARYRERAQSSDILRFRYDLDCLENKSDEVLIRDLTAITDDDYEASYAYKLAELYKKAGKENECRKECRKIIAWFPDSSFAAEAVSLIDLPVHEPEGAPASEASDTVEAESVPDADILSETVTIPEKSETPEDCQPVAGVPDTPEETDSSFTCDPGKLPQFELAVNLLRDEDYILTDSDMSRVYKLISTVCDDPHAAAVSEDYVNSIIKKKIKKVIKNAEDRNMKSLFDVVMNNKYKDCSLLRLSEEDFTV